MQFEQAIRHHGQVGHHVVLPEKTAKGLHHRSYGGVGLVKQLVELLFGLRIPMPRIFECFDLSGAVRALWRLEQEVIIAFRVERWVEIDQINRFRRNRIAQHPKVVAVVKVVHR